VLDANKWGVEWGMDYDGFERRHIGPSLAHEDFMLATLGYSSLDQFLAGSCSKEHSNARAP
jgi:glycine cleavage system pyridoxal-binding protein P